MNQPARDRLVMDLENPADRSHPHPFEIELTGPLLEDWILCLIVVFERSVGRLDNVSVGHHGWYHSEWSQDEHSEDIASSVFQISEITSFV